MKTTMYYRAFAIVALAITSVSTVSCDRGARAARVPLAPNVKCHTPGCDGYVLIPYVNVSTKYGTGCLGNLYGGTTPRPDPAPLSYLVNDIGKPGFPHLNADELRLIRSIQSYVHSDTLRLAWLAGTRRLIVFDATDGPCSVTGYEVLTGPCNAFYAPGENPYATVGAPAEAFPSCKRPWVRQEWFETYSVTSDAIVATLTPKQKRWLRLIHQTPVYHTAWPFLRFTKPISPNGPDSPPLIVFSADDWSALADVRARFHVIGEPCDRLFTPALHKYVPPFESSCANPTPEPVSGAAALLTPTSSDPMYSSQGSKSALEPIPAATPSVYPVPSAYTAPAKLPPTHKVLRFSVQHPTVT